jgi:hypothetical protein
MHKEGEAETWQTYKARADLENAKVNYRSREAAYVWLRNTSIIAATVTTEAGEDWINYAAYCFREDGATARVASELRVSAGKMIVRRSWFNDPEGIWQSPRKNSWISTPRNRKKQTASSQM